MLVSRCCKDVVYCMSSDCEAYYVCKKCKMACDAVFSLQLNGDEQDDDTGNADKVKAILDAA